MRVRSKSQRAALWLLMAAAAVSGVHNVAISADRVAPAKPAEVEPSDARNPSVVLITLDGVRWQEIFHGVDARLARHYGLAAPELRSAASLTPNLHRLMSQYGAGVGAGTSQRAHDVMRASGPNFVSLPGYIELLTGKRRSGCTANDCGAVTTPTLLDELNAQTGQSSVVFSSWPVVGMAASHQHRGVLSSLGRESGEQRETLAKIPGVAAAFAAGERDPFSLGDTGYRSDVHTARAALAYMHAKLPRLMFVSLGDTDEYGHADDYRGYLRALSRADAFVGRAMQLVSQRIAAGYPTTLVVTTDHGRADSFSNHGGRYPESARVWLAAMGSGIGARGNVTLTRPRHLADVAPTLRVLLGLRSRHEPDQGQVLGELLLDASKSAPIELVQNSLQLRAF